MGLFDIFKTSKKSKNADNSGLGLLDNENNNHKFKVTIVEFNDVADSKRSLNLSYILKDFPDLITEYYDDPFSRPDLEFEGENFFNVRETGQLILEKTEADVLIWGFREDDKIRLNLQNDYLWDASDNNFINLFDSIYIPAKLLNNIQDFPSSIANMLYGAILCATNPRNQKSLNKRNYILDKIIKKLANDNPAKNISMTYIPFIMNTLGIIYHCNIYNKNEKKDIKDYNTAKQLFYTAIKNQNILDDTIHLGSFYYHLGDLFDDITTFHTASAQDNFLEAIKCYRKSQSYFTRSSFPYDYAYISYRISKMLYRYWKLKEDIQALRDAVAHLRDAENIFTYAFYPFFWAKIQGDLGHMLFIQYNYTRNDAIAKLSIKAYQNKQKVHTEHRSPIIWAETQNKIGEIYFELGKSTRLLRNFELAEECFQDALFVFNNEEDEANNKLSQVNLNKLKKYLKR
jgi:hypothetical protein